MSGKQEKQKKSNMPPPETRDFEVGDPVDSVESYVQELLQSMIKSLMDSVVTSISERIDGIVKDVAQLKASLDLTWKNHVNELSKTVVNFPNKGTMLMLLYLLCITIPLFTPFFLMVFKLGVSHTQPTYLFLPCCPTSSWVRCAFLICKQNMLRSYAHVLHFLQSSE